MSAPAKMLPLLNRILIKKADPVVQSRGGVLIPDARKHRITRGTVVAVGPGTKNDSGKCIPCCLKVGDVVVLPDYGGTKVQYEDKQEYFLYRENDILAKING